LFQHIQSLKTELIANVYQIRTTSQENIKFGNLKKVLYFKISKRSWVLTEEKDHNKELKETQQEVMIDLKIKTNSFLEKLKEQAKKDRVQM
jgi:hypothetical protein